MIFKYQGQQLEYIKDFHGREVLWITNSNQIHMQDIK